ncbi:MAG: peptidyl-prolyl cis-trans isomerase [Paracoccaceae bacterium]|nr:peptidyl-prolyl cis-trans isomerase [Paracoccaceae bacterium]
MARKSGSISKTFVWILLGLLIIGLAGFGATSFSGGVARVGSVGDTEITVDDYFRGLRNEIRAVEAQTGQALPFQQAQQLGLTDQVLSQLVVFTALDHEAASLGISIGDERLAQEIRNVPAFAGSDGDFNRDAYAFALQNAGLDEAEFEADLRSESARTLLQGAILAGTSLPDTYVNTLLTYAAERRAFTWTQIDDTALAEPIPAPTDAQLQAFYDENIADYTRPETRALTYAWLTPEMILDTVEVDADSLRAAYDERTQIFNQPERRLVERLVFADDAAAQAAYDQLTAGEATFEALVEARGLDLSDADLGDVSAADLGDAAEVVFALSVGDVSAPAPSDLGPALYRVNGILPAQSTSFEEAEPALREELALDRARRVIETQAQSFDDEMAAGATLEELTDSTDMQLGQIGWTGAEDDGIAAYDAFRELAETVTTEDFPAIDQLGDGGVFALRLDDIQPPAPIPFDEVRDQVADAWTQAQVTEALVAQAETLAAQLAEGRTFEALELTPLTETGLTRNASPQGLPPGLVLAAFEMEKGAVQAVPGAGAALILRLDDIIAADPEAAEVAQLSQVLRDQAANDVANDLFRALASDIQQRAGVTIDQTAINAVHASFQ